jgi:hypothetical protein
MAKLLELPILRIFARIFEKTSPKAAQRRPRIPKIFSPKKGV